MRSGIAVAPEAHEINGAVAEIAPGEFEFVCGLVK